MLYRIIFGVGLCLLILLGSASYSDAETITNTAKVTEVAAATGTSTAKNNKAGGEGSEVLISLGEAKLTMEHINWIKPGASNSQIAWLAERWLENELLYAEAERRGITKQRKARFLVELTMKGRFVQELRTQVREAVEISDERALAHYRKTIDTDPGLSGPGYLTFSHVRTKTLEEAQAVLRSIKAGENINDLARQRSIHSDAGRGGMVKRHMYMAVEKRFGQKFLDALKTAKKGELIGPVKVEQDDGYEVALKQDETKPIPRPFDKVKDRIKSRLEREEKDKALTSLLDSLTKAAADKVVKSPRLIEAERAGDEQRRRVEPTSPRPGPKPPTPR
jgi:hypothetical protein